MFFYIYLYIIYFYSALHLFHYLIIAFDQQIGVREWALLSQRTCARGPLQAYCEIVFTPKYLFIWLREGEVRGVRGVREGEVREE
jgi:hypothetical protein